METISLQVDRIGAKREDYLNMACMFESIKCQAWNSLVCYQSLAQLVTVHTGIILGT